METKSTKEVSDGIVQIVKKRGYVTFVEILKEFPEERGEYGFCAPHLPNVILWPNISERLGYILRDLIESGEIHVHPSTQLIYAMDGKLIELPIAKKLFPYKKPHWFPVTFHHSPYTRKKRN